MYNCLMELSEYEQKLMNTPLIQLSTDDKRAAFSIMDKIAEYNWRQPKPEIKGFMQDKDKLLKDGVKSPADGKAYSNRGEWNEMLKRNNCVEYGNDQKCKPRPVQMKNMNLKPAIKQALEQARSRH